MNDELQRILENNIDQAVAHGYKMNRHFALIGRKGYYMPKDDNNLCCHPLETVVLGQPISNPINVDVANNLGVRPSWVDGFMDGYGSGTYSELYQRLPHNDPTRKHYTEGFEDGHEVEDWFTNMDWPI